MSETKTPKETKDTKVEETKVETPEVSEVEKDSSKATTPDTPEVDVAKLQQELANANARLSDRDKKLNTEKEKQETLEDQVSKLSNRNEVNDAIEALDSSEAVKNQLRNEREDLTPDKVAQRAETYSNLIMQGAEQQKASVVKAVSTKPEPKDTSEFKDRIKDVNSLEELQGLAEEFSGVIK